MCWRCEHCSGLTQHAIRQKPLWDVPLARSELSLTALWRLSYLSLVSSFVGQLNGADQTIKHFQHDEWDKMSQVKCKREIESHSLDQSISKDLWAATAPLSYRRCFSFYGTYWDKPHNMDKLTLNVHQKHARILRACHKACSPVSRNTYSCAWTPKATNFGTCQGMQFRLQSSIWLPSVNKQWLY